MRWIHISLSFAVAVAILFAIMCALAFVANDYAREWENEQSHIDDYSAVISPNGKYLPNLDLVFESVVNERYHKFFPFVNPKIFDRVAVLDHLGPASSYDFADCLVLEYVHTIHIEHHNDTEEIVKVFKKFPRLKKVVVGIERSQYDGTSIVDLIRKELPHVFVDVR